MPRQKKKNMKVCIDKNIDITSLLEKYEKKQLDLSGLLSIKPKIYVCNVDEKSLVNGNKYVDSCIKKYGKNKICKNKAKYTHKSSNKHYCLRHAKTCSKKTRVFSVCNVKKIWKLTFYRKH